MTPSLLLRDDLQKRMLLLREATELLMWELSAIAERKWEELPDLKKRKESLATRLREFDWTPGPQDLENADLAMLKSQICDLEYQSRKRIEVQMQLIRTQIDALQDQQQYWLECLHVYFGKRSKGGECA